MSINVGKLILQTYELTDFLLLNWELIDIQTKKECLNNIMHILSGSLTCIENGSEIAILKSYLNDDNFQIFEFYRLISVALIKFKVSKIEALGQVSELVDQKDGLINSLSERFSHQQQIQSIYHKRYPGISNRFSGKGVIYSAITGNYDAILEPTVATDDYEYVMITDHIPDDYQGRWQIRIVKIAKVNSTPFFRSRVY